jgi:hypothetical protein
MFRQSLIATGLVVALAGCVATPPLLTNQEIETAQAANNLDTLYTQYAAKLTEYKLTTPEGQQAKAQLDLIGRNLADKRAQEIRQTLQQKTTKGGFVPLPIIAEEDAKSLRMQQWSPAAFQAFSTELNGVKTHTDSRIKSLQDTMAKFSIDEAGKRPAILTELAELSGDNRYIAERQATIQQIEQRITDSIKAEKYETAKKALFALKEATPDDKTIPDRMLQVDTRLFEKNFWDNLTQGKTDEAYAQFIQVSQSADFPTILKGLAKSPDDMVSYFTALAGTASNESRFQTAWKLFQQAQDIRARTNSSLARTAQETAFADIVAHQYQVTNQATYPGVSLGYLAVIERINPDAADLATKWQKAEAAVLKKITNALAVSEEAIPSDKIAEYTEVAKSYAKDGNAMLAAESAAKAFVIANSKKKDTRAVKALLEENAVKTLAP